MTEHIVSPKKSFHIWNDCNYAVFQANDKGEIVYANNHALKLFAKFGYPAIKNIKQIPVFRNMFDSGLLLHEQEIEWIADQSAMRFTMVIDAVSGQIGFFANKPQQSK